MNVDVKKFTPGKLICVGVVDLFYGPLLMSLRIRSYKREHFYVEMPQVKKKEKYIAQVRWTSKELSDAFQAEVLKQIVEKFGNVMGDPREWPKKGSKQAYLAQQKKKMQKKI